MKSPVRPGSTSVIEFLQRHEAAAGLLPAAQRIVRLGQDLRLLLPPALKDSCEVAGFDDGTVLLKVSSAGLAAKLRQTLPRLADGLQQRGWQVSAIRTRVQPGGSPTTSATWAAPSEAAIPTSAVAAFGDLSRSLDDSPLKTAVDRLVRRRAPTS